MKRARLTLSALTSLLLAFAAHAGDFETSGLGEAVGKRNCTWCHGQDGQGFSTAPRLAGQTRLYIQSQLADFTSHARDNPKSHQFMWGAAAEIGPEAKAAVAEYFASLAPIAAADGNPEVVDSGRLTYRDGKIERNIPSCVACHGPNGEGVGAIPRLSGLSHRYLTRRLREWGEGYHLAAKAPMAEIAKALPPDDIEALASFLSFGK